MIFRKGGKEYSGATAVEVVAQLAREARQSDAFENESIYEFLQWSLTQFGDRIPTRELDLSGRLSDETLARSYLLLLDEYGEGDLVGGP